jgi:exopolysaccharide production protein ExoZ
VPFFIRASRCSQRHLYEDHRKLLSTRDLQRPNQSDKLVGIQILRAVAALLVLYSHAWHREGQPGASGVDLFFIISGFIMVYISSGNFERPRAPIDFLTNRAKRIVPPYFLATLAAIIILNPSASASKIAQSFLFLPMDGQLPLLPVGWTLDVEMMFYVIFGLGLFMPKLLGLGFAFACIVFLGTVRFYLNVPISFVRWTDPTVLAFAYGMAIGIAFRAGVRFNAIVSLALFSVGLLAFGYYASDFHQYSGTPIRPLVWGLPWAFVVAAVALSGREFRSPLWRPLVFIGNASYSIYLWHYFVGHWPGVEQIPHTMLVSSSIAVTSLCVGILAFKLLEEPRLVQRLAFMIQSRVQRDHSRLAQHLGGGSLRPFFIDAREQSR